MANYGKIIGDVFANNNTQQQNNLERYGELLDTIDPNEESMYQAFDDYFNHPTMVKIKNVNGYSMYMSKTYCLLSNECRYIIAFVHQDILPINTKQELSILKWVSLQTRTLSDNHNLPSHCYQPKRDSPLKALITRTEISKESSVYSCDEFPITITLLHTQKSNKEYQDKGNLIAALETYNTIICLK
jgi:hypothetical protein